MMGVFSWALLGICMASLVVGLDPDQSRAAVLGTMLAGIVGALAGGFAGVALGIASATTVATIGTWLPPIAGALVGLAVRGLLAGTRDRGPHRPAHPQR